MKTERRHELATNVLADWLGAKIEALRPYSAAVSVTALLVVVVIFASVMLYQKRAASTAQAWTDYFAAIENQSPDESTDKLEAVAVDHPGSPAGLWSRLSLADKHLADGVEDLFKDGASARKALERAIDDYQAVVEQAPRDSLLAERATFGLAEAYESKNELEEAREQYRTLLERWPKGAFSALANDRLTDLERKSTKDFYDWFAKQSPQTKPKTPGTLGEKPAFDLDKLPEDHFESGLNIGGKKVGGKVKSSSSDAAEPSESGDAKAPTSDVEETRGQGDKETRGTEK